MGGFKLKKRFTFIVLLAIIFALTTLLLGAYAKTQYEQIRYYKTSFFMGTQDLLENYQSILDFEKSYLMEKDINKKQQMLENHSNLLFLSENHSDSIRSLLYKQVNVDEFVELESNVRMEASSFQSSSSEKERQTHVKKLETAIARYKNFMDENMKAKDVCIYDSCDK